MKYNNERKNLSLLYFIIEYNNVDKERIICYTYKKGGIFMLLNYLEQNFQRNKPIFLTEIKYEDYSEIWILKEIKKLCEKNKLLKFGKGIYYLPAPSMLGGFKPLDVFDVAEKKYICSGKDVYGFYSGIGLLNRVGITNQTAGTVCISTNNEASRKRTVFIGNTKFILKKAYAKVDPTNVETMRFLNTITEMPDWYVNESSIIEQIWDYFSLKDITPSSVMKTIRFYPDATSKKLIESGLIYRVG